MFWSRSGKRCDHIWRQIRSEFGIVIYNKVMGLSPHVVREGSDLFYDRVCIKCMERDNGIDKLEQVIKSDMQYICRVEKKAE